MTQSDEVWSWPKPWHLKASDDGKELVWSGQRRALVYPSQTRYLLKSFLELEKASAEKVSVFASSFGVLDFMVGAMQGAEPVEHWRARIRLAAALVRVGRYAGGLAASLDEFDWSIVEPALPESLRPKRRTRQIARIAVGMCLGEWLREGRAGVSFDWRPSRPPKLVPRASTLLGALGFAIAAAIQTGDAIDPRNCRGCFGPLTGTSPTRVWCTDCRGASKGSDQAQAAASKAYRDRIRAVRKRVAQGEDPRAIARELGRPVGQISKWAGRGGR